LQVIKGQNLNFAVPGSRALALQEKAAALRVAFTSRLSPERQSTSLWWNLNRDQGHTGEKQGRRGAAAYRQAIRFQPELAGAFSGLGRPLYP
jgi:hypothetical protein